MARIVFKGGRVFDGQDVLPDGVNVVLDGNRITEVSSAEVSVSAEDTVIDLAGKTLMPGMV